MMDQSGQPPQNYSTLIKLGVGATVLVTAIAVVLLVQGFWVLGSVMIVAFSLAWVFGIIPRYRLWKRSRFPDER